jgi:serine/threonine-protein kinase
MTMEGAGPSDVYAGEVEDDVDLGCGTYVGEHEILGLLARGGCGAVYDARHRTLGTRGAVKVLKALYSAEAKMVNRFLQEIDLVNRLRHPNIVSVHEVGVLTDAARPRPFFVMEVLVGGTLDELLRLRGRLTPEEAFAVLAPVCAGLDAAHAEGVIHRDVKASNIGFACTREALVAKPFAGPAQDVKLLDFGIAKLLAPELGRGGLTTAGRPIGTPTIMAPEQLRGDDVDARVDVYALGVLLYRLLTGRTPFDATTPAALARKHLEDPAPRPSMAVPVSPALDAIVLRCMEKRPQRRFESAGAVAEALAEALSFIEGTSPLASYWTSPLASFAPSSGPPERAMGVAVDVELAFRPLPSAATYEEIDDALAVDVQRVLDGIEERLGGAGFVIVRATGDGVLAVLELAEEPGQAREARLAALEAVRAMLAAIEARSGKDDRLELHVAVHAGEILVKGGPRFEIVGGQLLCVAEWLPVERKAGITVSPEAARGIPGWEVVADREARTSCRGAGSSW